MLIEMQNKKIIMLSEGQFKRLFKENVYVNNIKGNKAFLTYKKGRNAKSKLQQDYLKTDKMDEDGAGTYEVSLKGGLTCYNITDIKGMEVMHYFKRLWDNKKTMVKVGKNDEAELSMENNEQKEFLDRFVKKIEYVVNYWVENNMNDEFEFTKISIYPIPSSSNFNKQMAKLISSSSILGKPIQLIDENLLVKDLRTLQRDEEFIAKNKDYYNGAMYQDGKGGSVNQNLSSNLNRLKQIEHCKSYITTINDLANNMLKLLYSIHQGKNNSNKMREFYIQYCDALRQCKKEAEYANLVSGDVSKIHFSKIAQQLKFSKGPSIKGRSKKIWDIVKPLLRGVKSPIDGEPYVKEDIVRYEPTKFEIKNMSNGERMGMRGIYNPNMDNNLVQKEVEKIKGSVFIIFDDNLSGGATLSDVCYACHNIGIENIIPITFGKMAEKTTIGMRPLTKNNNWVLN